MIGLIGTSLPLQTIKRLTISDCLRLAPFLTELRVSSLLRDWLGSDLRIGHFFSFRYLLVNTPQLNTEWLNSLTIQSVNEFMDELSLITRGEPKRDHHLQEFVYYSVILCLFVATRRA
jgi:hypothetical protein